MEFFAMESWVCRRRTGMAVNHYMGEDKSLQSIKKKKKKKKNMKKKCNIIIINNLLFIIIIT